tara:strand:- start:407 stop:829 length:423 start_codon:yes stop_codon:yes gene_type:complete
MFLEIIGKEIIVETTKAILHILTDLEDHEDPYVNDTMEELDIINRIQIIQSLIKTPITINNSTEMLKTTINMCCSNLQEIINKIRKELETIHQLVIAHKEKWFHHWREPDYHKNIENVKKYNKIMDGRFKLFLNILKTYH